MSELHQTTFLILGLICAIAIPLGVKLRVRWLFTITFFVAVSWYLDGVLWNNYHIIPDGPELTGIWGGLTSSIHRLFLEVIVPVFLMALWSSCICAAMVRKVVRRRIDV